MTTTASTTLMDPQVWTGKIFNGEWIAPTGGEYQVIEPSTGATSRPDTFLRSAKRIATSSPVGEKASI